MAAPFRKCLVFFLAASLLAACTTRYGWKGVVYDSVDEVTAVMAADWKKAVAHVEPARQRLPGRALLIVPDEATILRYETIRSKNTPGFSSGASQFALTANKLRVQAAVDAFEKRRLFASLTVYRADGESLVREIGDRFDYVVWLRADERSRIGWYTRAKGQASFLEIIRGLSEYGENEYLVFMLSEAERQLTARS